MRQKWLQKPPLGTPINWSHHLAKGLVGFWAFQEGGGDLANDLSGNANHGTLNNMAFPPTATSGWNAGRRGVGLNFDGTNDYVDCGSDASLNFYGGADDKPFSISAWFLMHPKTTAQSIVQKYTTASAQYNLFLSSTEKLSFRVFDYNPGQVRIGRTYDTVLSEGQWYYVVATYNGNKTNAGCAIYLNGLQVDDTDDGSGTYLGMDDISTNVNIGRYSTSYYFNGQIDEVRIYNRALSAEEIKQLYLYPYACFQQPCTAWLYAAAAGGLSIPVAMHNYRRMRT